MNSKRRLSSRRRRSQAGTALVESALVGPLFLLLLAGIVHFGVAIYSYNILTSAVRDGVRFAVVNGSTSPSPATSTSMQTYVRSRAIGLVQSNVAVTTSWTPDNKPGSVVKVQAKYTPPGLWKFLPGTTYLASVSQMVIYR